MRRIPRRGIRNRCDVDVIEENGPIYLRTGIAKITNDVTYDGEIRNGAKLLTGIKLDSVVTNPKVEIFLFYPHGLFKRSNI